MFLRKRGRRVLVLHSYRDGRGKVCQVQVGHFRDAEGLERVLGELPERFPESRLDLSRLRRQGLAGLEGVPDGSVAGRVERLRRAVRALLTMLAEEEDPQVVTQLAEELSRLRAWLTEPQTGALEERLVEAEDQLVRGELTVAEEALRELAGAARSQLSPRRRRFQDGDPKASLYGQVMESLGEVLQRQGRLSESAGVMAEAVACCPTPRRRLNYGTLLQRLGQPKAALDQYALLAQGEDFRHYHSASACWQEGRFDEALVHLLRGYTRAPEVGKALLRLRQGKPIWRDGGYWERFGEIWPEPARRFVQAICSQTLVRWNQRQARERGVVVRSLVPASSRVWLLQRGLDAVNGP